MTVKLAQSAKTSRKGASVPQGNGTAPRRGFACRKPVRENGEPKHTNQKEGENRIVENSFMRVDDVAKELGVSKSYAYKVVQKLNAELQKMGYLTISGRVSRKFFLEKFCYGGEERGQP